MERNIALVLEYDGSMYRGWQSQKNADTVQDTVLAALTGLLRRDVKLVGASRTDAGVHARGQIASFVSDAKIPPDKYAFALNTVLPAGVTCVGSYEVAPDFHARYSAVGKTYSYIILNRRYPSAILSRRAWHVPLPLDACAMREAAAILTGEHDFRAFMSTGGSVKSTVRKITRLDVRGDGIDGPDKRDAMVGGDGSGEKNTKDNRDIIRVTVTGNGFLYNMVRIIVGTLVYVGQGRLTPADVSFALSSGDRKAAGKTAPPQGLYLERVEYGSKNFN